MGFLQLRIASFNPGRLWIGRVRPFVAHTPRNLYLQATRMPSGIPCSTLLEAVARCDSWPYPSKGGSDLADQQQRLLQTTLELRLEDGVTAVGLIVHEVAKLIQEYNSRQAHRNELVPFIFSEGAVRFHPELNSESKRTSAIKQMVDQWREKDSLECLRGTFSKQYSAEPSPRGP